MGRLSPPGSILSKKEHLCGCYHLLLSLEKARRIRVGALGRVTCPAGYYVYTGSATRGLIPRLARHIRQRKKRHWHIDCLTTVAHVEQILVDGTGSRTECERHKAVMDLPGARVIIAGFGSSDCRCPSHLAYFSLPPRLHRLSIQPVLPPQGD